MDSKRSGSVLFNKNAHPFFPSVPNYQNYQNYPHNYPHNYVGSSFPAAQPAAVHVSNLPPEALAALLTEFLTSELPGLTFSIPIFRSGAATVEFAAWLQASTAVDMLAGCVWLEHTLSCEIDLPDQASDNTLSSLAPSNATSTAASPLHRLPSSSLVLLAGLLATPFFPPYVPYFPVNLDYGYFPPPDGFYGDKSRRTLVQLLPPRKNSQSHKPSPPFVLNMVQRRNDDQPSLEADHDDVDDGLIALVDDDGNAIRVNPRRLFVGNIPFNSTWPALKNFLVTRADELEPGNGIDILRVEIPMQQPRDHDTKLNSYLFVAPYPQIPEQKPDLPARTGSSRGLSRGFAIVTTANRTSLEKLIQHFDNADFEGRLLTVRFDRFPDYNNYVLQQLFPASKVHATRNKLAFLLNLAFERNLFQHQFYYGLPVPMPYNYYNYANTFPGVPVNPYARGPEPDVHEVGEISDSVQSDSGDADQARDLVNSFGARNLSPVQ